MSNKNKYLITSKETISNLENQIEKEIKSREQLVKDKETLLIQSNEMKQMISDLENRINDANVESILRVKKFAQKLTDLQKLNEILYKEVISMNKKMKSTRVRYF